MAEAQEENLLWRVHRLEQELEHLKRDLLRQLAAPSMLPFASPPSLFGSVRGEDVPEEIIEEAKQSLCRDLKDL